MDLRAEAALRAPAEAVFGAVADLSTYPHWLRIVLTAEPEPFTEAVWSVEIGARIGPLRRGKQLRMERTAHEGGVAVRFERAELDRREHSPWVLSADVFPAAMGCRLAMYLHYGGSAWLPLLDLVLAEEVKRAPARLDRYLAG